MINHIGKIVDHFVKKNGIKSFSTSIYFKGHDFVKNLGNIDDSSNIPVDRFSLFEIGSITKTITAILLQILHEKSLLDTSKSIYYYLGSEKCHPIFKEINIKNILSHTSGLPRLDPEFDKNVIDLANPYLNYTNESLASFLKEPYNIEEPGNYNYSNLGYGILSYIVEYLFNKPYEHLVEEEFFSKVGMNRTYTIDTLPNDKNITAGYTNNNILNPYWNVNVMKGAGCFFSCSNDLLRFIKINLNIDIGDEKISKAISSTQILQTKEMALGWHYKNGFLAKLLLYKGYYWHNGMTGGFSSFICFNPKKQIGFSLLANKIVALDTLFYEFMGFQYKKVKSAL